MLRCKGMELKELSGFAGMRQPLQVYPCACLSRFDILMHWFLFLRRISRLFNLYVLDSINFGICKMLLVSIRTVAVKACSSPVIAFQQYPDNLEYWFSVT